MSKKTNKKLSRQEPTSPKGSVVPAGTPTAPSVPDAPAAVQQTTPAVGESLKLADVMNVMVLCKDDELKQAKGKDVVSAVVPGEQAAVGVVTPPVAAPAPRRGGASWFIPPQRPSQFGIKK
jgi:hypothetical protein